MQYKDVQRPLISVIIPTIASRKHLLDRALKSVKNQTYENIEILTISGHAASESRNIGIKQSKGDFIAFLDDDDEWMYNKLELQLNELLKYPSVPLVVCYTRDKRFEHDRINKPKITASQHNIISFFNYSSTSSYLIRRYALELIKENDEYFDTSLPSAQEYDIAIRLSEHHNLMCLPEVLMIQNSTKCQISEDWKRKIKGMIAVYHKYHKKYKLADHAKFLGLVVLFSFGFIVGNRIHVLIIPVKEMYEGG